MTELTLEQLQAGVRVVWPDAHAKEYKGLNWYIYANQEHGWTDDAIGDGETEHASWSSAFWGRDECVVRAAFPTDSFGAPSSPYAGSFQVLRRLLTVQAFEREHNPNFVGGSEQGVGPSSRSAIMAS